MEHEAQPTYSRKVYYFYIKEHEVCFFLLTDQIRGSGKIPPVYCREGELQGRKKDKAIRNHRH